MRMIIFLNVVIFIAMLAGLIVISGDHETGLIVLAVVIALLASGSLTAYLWFVRGRVYYRRGESGPDDS